MIKREQFPSLKFLIDTESNYTPVDKKIYHIGDEGNTTFLINCKLYSAHIMLS